MSKRNWSDILQAQRDRGLSIEAFCRVKKLARSNFFIRRGLGCKSQHLRLSQTNKQRCRVCCPLVLGYGLDFPGPVIRVIGQNTMRTKQLFRQHNAHERVR